MARDLTKARIWRGGLSGHMIRLTPEWGPLSIEAGRAPVAEAPLSLKLSFDIPSKGGGMVRLRVCLLPEDFETVAEMMMQADPVAAQRAFGAALVKDAERQD
ncbi:hypothetical protein ACIQW5_26930 [Methylorubrum thiocyanatum]|uniref:hypothetical protein n=1 Tax=Methylorubrum thiocyanatum TaxID=47958 RepID=UPI00383AF8E7